MQNKPVRGSVGGGERQWCRQSITGACAGLAVLVIDGRRRIP